MPLITVLYQLSGGVGVEKLKCESNRLTGTDGSIQRLSQARQVTTWPFRPLPPCRCDAFCIVHCALCIGQCALCLVHCAQLKWVQPFWPELCVLDFSPPCAFKWVHCTEHVKGLMPPFWPETRLSLSPRIVMQNPVVERNREVDCEHCSATVDCRTPEWNTIEKQ